MLLKGRPLLSSIMLAIGYVATKAYLSISRNLPCRTILSSASCRQKDSNNCANACNTSTACLRRSSSVRSTAWKLGNI